MQNHANSMSFLKIPRGRRELLGMAGLAALMFAFQPHGAAAQETGGEAGGGHSGGGESGGGESEGKHGAGKTPGERARRHRQRTGKTLGGGESGGGHTGGGEDEGTVLPPDGSTSGPIGGGSGGEHFIHEGQGGWGADNKVLRSP